MSLRTRSVLAAVALHLTAISIYAAPAAPALAAVIHDGEIVVSNVNPGGEIVLFSLGRDADRNGIVVRSRTLVLHDETKSGVIHFKPGEGIVLRSVWIAIDLSSGTSAVIAPLSYPLNVTRLPVNAFNKNSSGEIASLDSDLLRLKLLVVRPGKGAWTLYVHKGGGADHGNGNKMRLEFGDAVALSGKDAAPKHLIPGDVVAAIDPGHLGVFLAEIGK
jgi:hypothetical protein